jgi:hypothetical protein
MSVKKIDDENKNVFCLFERRQLKITQPIQRSWQPGKYWFVKDLATQRKTSSGSASTHKDKGASGLPFMPNLIKVIICEILGTGEREKCDEEVKIANFFVRACKYFFKKTFAIRKK